MITKETNMKKLKSMMIMLAILQTFNGLSGLAGGFGLINDPSGVALAMKLEWLQSTPFQSYLIPGLVLFTLNGIGNIIGLVLSLKKHPHSGQYAGLFGAVMMIWIIAQVSWLGYLSFLQPLYFSTGLLQLVMGIALDRAHKKNYTAVS